MPIGSLLFVGRVISKKNSKQWIRRGVKTYLVPSARHSQFEHEALAQFMQQRANVPAELKTAAVKIHMEFYIPGKYRVDGDNLYTSMLDAIQKAGLIDDDAMVMFGSWKKIPGSGGWSTKITISDCGDL